MSDMQIEVSTVRAAKLMRQVFPEAVVRVPYAEIEKAEANAYWDRCQADARLRAAEVRARQAWRSALLAGLWLGVALAQGLAYLPALLGGVRP